MIFSERYRQDNNLWMPNEEYNFQYSDGDEAENYILNAIQQSGDLSIGSDELFAYIKDWSSLYHLSPKRADLLRPLTEQLKGRKILEIGSGCGSITRFLGEMNCEVLALEGSLRRARITRERCRGLENVEVVSDNFDAFVTEEKFDCITLIGVLEYSNLFIKGDNPPLAMLNKVKQLLKPEGYIIIGIENKLGLKYLAGAPEDHLGVAFFGIENKYKRDTAITFGKEELKLLLEQAGLDSTQFLYPFPDYKLPVTIITDNGLQKSDFDVPGLLLEKHEYIQGHQHNSFFNISLAERELHRNKLAGEMANSFLVIAAEKTNIIVDPSLLAVSYSTSRRKAYCKSVEFKSAPDQSVLIAKKRIHDISAVNEGAHLVIESELYKPGILLQEMLLRIISVKNWSLQQLTEWAKQYYTILEKKAQTIDGRLYLNGKHLDLTPFNIIIEDNGEPFIFDQEWDCKELLPIEYVFFRGIYYSLGQIVFFSLPEQEIPRCLFELSILLLKNFHDTDPKTIDEFREKEKKYFAPVWLQEYTPFLPEPMRVRPYDLFNPDTIFHKSKGDLSLANDQLNYFHPSLSFIHAQVFWTNENEDFNETNSISEQIQLSTSATNHLFKTEQELSDIKRIRIDPSNQLGIFYLHSISIVDISGKIILDWDTIMQTCIFRNLALIKSSMIENAFLLFSITDDPIIELELPAAETPAADEKFNLMVTVSRQDIETIVKELSTLTANEVKKGLSINKGRVLDLSDILQSTISDLNMAINDLNAKIVDWQFQKEEFIQKLASKDELININQKEATEKDQLLVDLQKKIEHYESSSILKLIQTRLINPKKVK